MSRSFVSLETLRPEDISRLREAFHSNSDAVLDKELDKIRQAVKNEDPKAVIMSLPTLLALTICPALLGTQEAIRQSQSKTRREEHRARRCNLVVSCVKRSIRSRDINNKLVVLRDNKLYISHELSPEENDHFPLPDDGYPFSGYFLPYPDTQYEGLVSTIMDEPPMLNWIYIDKDTYEVKYGVRDFAQPNITGPFDCTKQDRRMTLEGWEGFCAVEETPGVWALYFDRDDDGLKAKMPMGTRVLEIELIRREKKEKKPKSDLDVPKTLEEMMTQHKAQTEQEEADKAAFLAEENQRQEGHHQSQTQPYDEVEEEASSMSPGAHERGYEAENEGTKKVRTGVKKTVQSKSASNPLNDTEKREALKNTLDGINRVNNAFARLSAGPQRPVVSNALDNAPSDTATNDQSTNWNGSDQPSAAQIPRSVTAASSMYEPSVSAPRKNGEDDNASYRQPYVEEELVD